MFVLGIDPGLTTTGYGAVRRAGGRSEAVAVGVIRTSTALPLAQRLLELHRDLTGLIDDIHPEVVAIEQVFVNRNLSTATNVGRASGVILLAAAAAGLEVAEYSPSAVKATVTGDGSADKRQVKEMVSRRLGLATPPSPADAADALAIALCHLQSSGHLQNVQRGMQTRTGVMP
jgi:crossover junction endodeoxyribonuclease RuvC